MSAAIEARGLVKRYGPVTAVDHVDLTVRTGDVYGYLGPNGAGKTTSLRMLLGLIRPDEGTAKLFGRDPLFEGASGFLLGAQIEYQMLSWFSAPLRFFGEDRDFQFGRYRVYSISPGIAFRTDWQSTDRIELIYTRRFYNSAVDDNPARPLDPSVLALGAYINF